MPDFADEAVTPQVRKAAAWAWRLVVLAAAAAVLFWLIQRFVVIVVPLALALIQSSSVEQALRDAPALVARYRLPEPRVSLGTSLRGLATAAIDVSDGLVADLGHICRTSAVGAEVEASIVPLSPEAQNLLSKRSDLSERVFAGGDDYELLFTARPEDAENLSAISEKLHVPLTRIGRTIEGDSPVLVSESGKKINLAGAGWRHF